MNRTCVVITRGPYNALRIVAVASSEAEARRMIGEHQDTHGRSDDYLSRFEIWGPLKLDDLEGLNR